MMFGCMMMAGSTASAPSTLLNYTPGGTITFTGSNAAASYRDNSNVWQAGAVDTVRDNHFEYSPVAAGMVRTTLLETQRAQKLLNPGSPASPDQVVSLATGWHVLWIEGTGSVSATGATDGAYGTATANPNNGTVTGVQGTDWLLFNVSTTQNVTFAVTGTVDRYNCIAYSGTTYPTPRSYVSSQTNGVADAGRFTLDFSPQELSVYIRCIHFGFDPVGSAFLFRMGSGAASNASFRLVAQANRWLVEHREGASTVDQVLNHSSVDVSFSGNINQTTPDPYVGDVMEIRAVLNSTGSCFVGVSLNGATEVVGATSGTLAIGGSWSVAEMSMMGLMAGAVQNVMVAPGVKTMAECRTLAGV